MRKALDIITIVTSILVLGILGGGTITGSSASLFKVKYDADGAPAWTSGYYLEVVHSAQIGTVSIT